MKDNGCGGLSLEKLEYTNKTKNWSYYSQQWRPYYLDESAHTSPLDLALPIYISTVANNFKIEGPASEFILLPPVNTLSDYKDKSAWSTLSF